MHFGLFALASWNIYLWEIDLLDTDLDLLVGHGQIQIFPVNILFVSKMTSRHILKTCLEDVFKTCFQDVFETCFEDVLKTSSV